MKKLSKIVKVLLILLAFVEIFTFFFWLNWPYKTLVFTDEKFPILTKEVKPGEKIVYLARFCKYTNLPTTVILSFVDGIIYQTPPIIVNRPKGCREEKIVKDVPLGLGKNEYKMVVNYLIKVNPIRTITVIHESEPFIIK